jgi:hypothetical protein
MIERLWSNSTGADLQGIQPVSDASLGEPTDSQPATFSSTSLLGETHWMGAMNAFRIARTFETQQQAVATASGASTLADPAANQSALIPGEAGELTVANVSGEFRLIPNVIDPQNTAGPSNNLRRHLEFEISANASTGSTEVVRKPVETAGTSEATSVKTRLETRQVEFERRPVEFRGYLVRVGQTSEFVVRLPS